MPDISGRSFASARAELESQAVEFTWLRLHDRPGDTDGWQVCEQYPAAAASTEDEAAIVIIGAECLEDYPDLSGKTVGEAERYLDQEGMAYAPLDAGDDDFPQTLEPRDSWIMCFLDIRQSMERTAEGLTGFLAEDGAVVTLEGYVAPAAAGCSASNEAEEQGDVP